MIDLKKLEVWFVTGSQHLYGPETLKQVDAGFQADRPGLCRGPSRFPVKVVFKPVADDAGGHLRPCMEANTAPELHRPDHLDAHVLALQDVDRRAAAAEQALRRTCTRSSTATFPGPTSTWTS